MQARRMGIFLPDVLSTNLSKAPEVSKSYFKIGDKRKRTNNDVKKKRTLSKFIRLIRGNVPVSEIYRDKRRYGIMAGKGNRFFCFRSESVKIELFFILFF